MALARMYEVLKTRFDDGDVDSPLEFKYICQVIFVMSTIGCWPHRQFGRNRLDTVLSLYNSLLVFVGIILLILGIIYFRINMEKLSFFDLGHTFLCIVFEIMFLQKLLLARMEKYRETIKDSLLKFHLFYFKNRSPYAAKIHAKIHVISGVFTLYVICQMAVGLSLFIFMPWYNNYSRGMFDEERSQNITFEHSVYYYLPDACYSTVKGYWLLFAFNVPISYVTTIGLCVFDLLLCLIVFQIWGHLKILKHNLSSLPLPANSSGMYSADENIQIRRILKENIVHYGLIIKFVDRCSDAFSEYLFIFYLLMQVITCILLLEVSSFTTDALAKYGPLTIGMHQQLIQVSILFEMINTKSSQLIDAVYAVPWERMDSGNRRTVLLLLARVQRPVSLKAAKVVPVGVNTMSGVLKTTFSYFMVLNAVAGER